ncbi:MAG: NAD(+) diphosphatase [Candidatus Aminicenantes bacterium]|nr:NAD(+) diphosphatase [Candidatus Aminicenantes bacterium]
MNTSTKFVKEINIPKKKSARSFRFIFREDRLLVHSIGNDKYTIPHIENLQELNINPIRTQYLGRYGDICCFSAEAAKETKAPTGMVFQHLWGLYDLIDSDLFQISGYAQHIMKWDQTSQYCGRCGAQTKNSQNERAKICENCNLISYPRISPAVIVAVVKENKILLAKSSRFRHRDMYSVLAGFVDPGETLEECVSREIKEETNIEVENIKYFGSQPWPFPDSLMVGFTADYKSGEISIDGDEIVAADWFAPDKLPNIPGKLSIARKLIDRFIQAA